MVVELFLRNNSLGCIKSFIFDKDGTISNSENFLLELAEARIQFAANKFADLKINKLKILLLKKLLNSLYGLKNNCLSANAIMSICSREQNIFSTATIFTLFGLNWFKAFSISQEIFDEVDIFLSINKENNKRSNNLISGALELLLSLKEKEIKIALMTNDSHAGIKDFIFRNQLEDLFDYLWSAENKPSKPNPMAVIELCKRMEIKPSECALISDADTDLRMAKEADIAIVIGFTGGWINPPTLTEKQLHIEKLNELKFYPKP